MLTPIFDLKNTHTQQGQHRKDADGKIYSFAAAFSFVQLITHAFAAIEDQNPCQQQ